ncbi:MAG TPA: hypothetical protein VKW08_12025 [Xanthobacteraceae bacterium]|jgi:hypothetical protein|nr:hypothetical protein [Xanthobacteraceae bacterium]
MLYALMLIGIGFLSACLLIAALAPVIHERAVRLTVRRLLFKRPRSRLERHAYADQLRAEFAVSTRRLETAMENTLAKSVEHHRELTMALAKRSAEVGQLQREVRRLSVVILRFQSRELMRRSTTRTVIKLLVYLFERSQQPHRQQLAARGFGRQEHPAQLGTVSA